MSSQPAVFFRLVSIEVVENDVYFAAFSCDGAMRRARFCTMREQQTQLGFGRTVRMTLKLAGMYSSTSDESSPSEILGPLLIRSQCCAGRLERYRDWLMEEPREETMEALIAFL